MNLWLFRYADLYNKYKPAEKGVGDEATKETEHERSSEEVGNGVSRRCIA